MSKSKIFAIVFVILIVLSSACVPVYLSVTKPEENNDVTVTDNIDTNVTEKWVLTKKEVYSSENQIFQKSESYEYDLSGRIISETIDYITDIYTSHNFEYDDKNNVISKVVEHTENFSGNTTYSNWSYVYDSNSNCIKETVDWTSDNYQDITEFEYNEKGTVIKEHNKTTDTSYPFERVTTYQPVYENNKCIQKNVIREILTDNTTYYGLYTYTYDENNNLKSETYYDETIPIDISDYSLEINGKYYKLSTTTYFTYEKLDDISTTETTNYNTETTTQPTRKLSDDCDNVLASGYDAEDNYYELVANETQTYSSVTIEMGVIKNNQWLIEPTTDMPFIDPNNGLIKFDDTKAGEFTIDDIGERNKFIYIGCGCFCSWSSSVNRIIYNANNRKHYIGNPIVMLYNEEIFETTSGEVLINSGRELLNVNTMQTTKTNFEAIKYTNQNCLISPYSEGLFCFISLSDEKASYNGFYNKNGIKVIDLSSYNLISTTLSNTSYSLKQSLVFKDGYAVFRIKNDVGTEFEIKIDKQGNVVSSIET